MPDTCTTTHTLSSDACFHWLDLTLGSPAENLALDHALLEAAERKADYPEVLRVWQSPDPLVVLGRSSCVAEEVNDAACREDSIPILRRVSGGATILAGPGCLMYSLLLDLKRRPELKAVDAAHSLVLNTLTSALSEIEPTIHCAGTSDLVVERDDVQWKCSGNSLRVGRNRLLYHGTLLYNFDLSLLSRYLLEPPRQPEYRQRRPHGRFVANLNTDRQTITAALRAQLGANDALSPIPMDDVNRLVSKHYGREEWNRQR